MVWKHIWILKIVDSFALSTQVWASKTSSEVVQRQEQEAVRFAAAMMRLQVRLQVRLRAVAVGTVAAAVVRLE
jgi:hypothetical protein